MTSVSMSSAMRSACERATVSASDVGRVISPSRRNTAMPPMSTHGWVVGNRPRASMDRASTVSRATPAMMTVAVSPDTLHL